MRASLYANNADKVQTLHSVVSDQDLHCLLTECFIKSWGKNENITQHALNWKLTRPSDKGSRQVHLT